MIRKHALHVGVAEDEPEAAGRFAEDGRRFAHVRVGWVGVAAKLGREEVHRRGVRGRKEFGKVRVRRAGSEREAEDDSSIGRRNASVGHRNSSIGERNSSDERWNSTIGRRISSEEHRYSPMGDRNTVDE